MAKRRDGPFGQRIAWFILALVFSLNIVGSYDVFPRWVNAVLTLLLNIIGSYIASPLAEQYPLSLPALKSKTTKRCLVLLIFLAIMVIGYIIFTVLIISVLFVSVLLHMY